ncbi:MAG: hypothetical protein U1F36_11405 [Planctomycetota bacterium]
MSESEPRVDDATLVAWIDNELDEATSADLRNALRDSPELQSREAMLRAARRLAAIELHRDQTRGGAATVRRRHRFEVLWVTAALALLALVFALARRTPVEDPASKAENRWLRLRVDAVRPTWTPFSAIAFDLVGEATTTTPCRVVARGLDEEDTRVIERWRQETAGDGVPLVLDAEILDPSGARHRGKVPGAAAEFTAQGGRLRVALTDVVVPSHGICPLFCGRPTEDGLEEDFIWPFRQGLSPTRDGRHGFVPEVCGDWRIRFELRTILPEGESQALRMAEPLAVEIGFRIEGVIGEDGADADGLRARLVVAQREVLSAGPVIALQLENRSDRPRAFNVVGTTLAPIPQPLHMDLLVDGAIWTQRTDLGVVIPAEIGFVPLGAGERRSIVISADYWRLDGKRLADLPGRHSIAIRFRFTPTTWVGDGRDLWMGSVETAPVEIEVRKHD